MVEDDECRIDVLTRMPDATKALEAVSLGLVDEQLGRCVAEAVVNGGAEAAARVRAPGGAAARLVRS